MKILAKKYFEELHKVISGIVATTSSDRPIDFLDAIGSCAEDIIASASSDGKVMFIGNGANAGISSHIAADLSKNTRIPAMAFNDPVMLTAAANDHGVDHMFSIPISVFARSPDILIALSSSGASKNIIRGIQTAKKAGCRIITISGFKPSNPIRRMGEYNFYSESYSYALVEVAHHAICHSLVNCIIEKRKEEAKHK